VDLAQGAAAQVENVRLLYQTELAIDYFQLHGVDGEIDLLERTVKSYEEYLDLTRKRFEGGIATEADVAQAETQLYNAQTQLTDLGVTRTQLEHAIAVLIGKPPALLTVPAMTLNAPLPQVPVALPSTLLERRPDVANAERTVASANEQIGIAKAAFYPAISLGGSAGFQSSSVTTWISWPSRFWSVGPQLAQTLFDAGRRRGELQIAEAQYDATVANYRQTVLTAFQQVEDNLSALRILEREAGQLAQATAAAQRSLDVSTAQYKAGTAPYLQVITAAAIVLADQRSVINLLERRLAASVSLIQALGGGWDTSKLPSASEVRSVK
jgi:NodT family efflux transporter outer membrane factor (OMF) lipoprotein